MLSEIKNRILSSLEGGGFQDLCDALLYALNLTHKFIWISHCFYAILKKKR